MINQQQFQALVHLSDWTQPVKAGELTSFIGEAPDPETARRKVLASISTSSATIRRKWLEAVDDMWLTQHPRYPLLLDLSVATSDLGPAAVVVAANEFLTKLAEQPIPLADVRPQDSRLRAALQAARLVRVNRGQLVIVRSRYERWREFPTLQQFFILWHVDTHHVAWPQFAQGPWQGYVRVIQNYLPLLWDVSYQQQKIATDCEAWSKQAVDAFAWAWEHDHHSLLPLERYLLLNVVEQLVLRDLFVRYGLVQWVEDRLRWTRLGQEMMATELQADVPCGIGLLD